MSLEMQNHTHKLQPSLIHQKVTMRPYLQEEICKITHTQIDLAHRSILLAFGLFFMVRYAPHSSFFFMLISEHNRKKQRGWKHVL
jgi:hypothetical protein